MHIARQTILVNIQQIIFDFCECHDINGSVEIAV